LAADGVLDRGGSNSEQQLLNGGLYEAEVRPLAGLGLQTLNDDFADLAEVVAKENLRDLVVFAVFDRAEQLHLGIHRQEELQNNNA